MSEKKLLDIVIKILSEYQLCPECLGRQFGLLGTNLSNTKRSRSLLNLIIMQSHFEILEGNSIDFYYDKLKKIASNANYQPAKRVLDKYSILYRDYNENFVCNLCNNLFLKTDEIIDKILDVIQGFEFKNFLIGTIMNPQIQDREDEFRVKFKISTGEAFKKNLNRVIGIKVGNILKQSVEFDKPEMNIYIYIEQNGFSIKIHSNPLCIQGKYHKYERGIPQTHWPHRSCRGKGCEECNFSGKQYSTSVEELITPFLQKYVLGMSSKFHGAGREDIDARCLGTGRPFIIEIKNPKKRDIPLKKIEQEIKEQVGTRVDAIQLKIVSRSEIKLLKTRGEETKKIYSVLIKSEREISKEEFDQKMKLVFENVVGKIIYQRTRLRVVHRRADKTREKKIFDIKSNWIDPRHSRLVIEAIGGTYIKELISSDSGRTNPSITSLFGIRMECIELDVLGVQTFK